MSMDSFKRNMKRRWEDLMDWWHRQPKDRQWKIAAGLLTVSTFCLALAVYGFFFHRGATNTSIEVNPVTLYTSADSALVTTVVQRFQDETGIEVKVVADTEATKTTGLVARLISEKVKPRADVWWSSEPMGSVTLAEAGILDPFVSRSESELKDGWPSYLRAKDKTWYGFAQRARVIAYNSNRLNKVTAPTRLRDLTGSRWNNKVGMARPQFGSTRTHIAVLVSVCGEEATRTWLQAMRDNGLKMYDSNSAVVQALATGEIDVGLTDTDDVWAAQRENSPVAMVYETADPPARPGVKIAGLPAIGPVVFPNTVARIRGGPHPNEARKLADFLLSAQVEEILANSDSRNIPIRPELAKKFEMLTVPNPAQVDAAAVAQALPASDRLISDVFPLP